MSHPDIVDHHGRGLPPYLLCRRDSESTIFSDGASRIFAPSNSVTSAKDTDFSSVSNDLSNISSNSVRFTDTDSESISESVTPKTDGNDSAGGTDSESTQTRTNASLIPACSYSCSQSTLNSITLDDEHDHETHENFTAGLCYLVGCAIMASGCPANNNQSTIQQDNNDDDIDSYTSPENMFPTYVPYGTENKVEDDEKEYQGLLNLCLAAYSLLLIFQKRWI